MALIDNTLEWFIMDMERCPYDISAQQTMALFLLKYQRFSRDIFMLPACIRYLQHFICIRASHRCSVY